MFIPIDQVHQLLKCCEQVGITRQSLVQWTESQKAERSRSNYFEALYWEKDIVPLQSFVLLIQAALALTNNPQLGVSLGKRLNFMRHGSVGLLAMASPNAADSLSAFVNHSQRANAPFMRFKQQTVDDEIRISLLPSPQVKNLERFVVDTALSSCITMNKIMLAGISDEKAIHKVIKYFSVSYGKPENLAAEEKYFADLIVPIRFNQPECQMVFNRKIANQENPNFNPGLIRSITNELSPICEVSETDLLTQIHNVLYDYDFRFPPLNIVASQLGLSERTLHRRLSALNMKYRSICDDLKETQAKTLITQNMPIDEVAFRVGYFDSASFYKAFKRWTGISPSTYRNSHKLHSVK